MRRIDRSAVRAGTGILVAVAVLALFVSRPLADDTAVRYTATAINMDPTINLTASTLDMFVTRWSTDAERDRLLGTLAGDTQGKKGQNQLLEAVRALPRAGIIKTPESMGYELRFARHTPLPGGGERVVLLTDRYMSFWEQSHGARSTDYPFTVIELRLGPDGKGEGSMTVATKIGADPDSHEIRLENYGESPIRLTNVRRDAK